MFTQRTMRLMCGLAILGMVAVLMVAACSDSATAVSDGAYVPRPAGGGLSTSPLAPGFAAQSTLFYAQRDVEAAGIVLTSQSADATQSAGSTQASLAQTAQAQNLKMIADAATSSAGGTATSVVKTDARAATLDAWTAMAATKTETHTQAQAAWTSTAVSDARAALLTSNQLTARAAMDRATAEASATAAQRALDAQTQEVRTWLPYVFTVLVGLIFIAFLPRLLRAIEQRQRVVDMPGAGSLIIQDQRRAIEEVFPNLPMFLRFVAWVIEQRQVIVNPAKALYPVTTISGGIDQSAQATDPDMQERVTRRAQAIELTRVLAQGGGEVSLPDSGPEAGGAGDGMPSTYQVIDPGEEAQWVGEIQQQLLAAPETQEGRLS